MAEYRKIDGWPYSVSECGEREKEGEADMICKCGKCGKTKEIVCLVDDVPYCEDCFLAAMGTGADMREER